MRLVPIVAIAILLSGCVQSSTSYESPDNCFMFCQEQSSSVEYNFIPVTLGVVLIAAVVVVIIAVAAAAGGERGGQQQQQQVVVVTKSEDDR